MAENEFPHDWLVWLADMIKSYCKDNADDNSQMLDDDHPTDDVNDTLKAIFGIKSEEEGQIIDEELMYSTLLCRTKYCYSILQTVLRDVADLPSFQESTLAKINIKEKSLEYTCLQAFWMKVTDAIISWRMSSTDDDV